MWLAHKKSARSSDKVSATVLSTITNATMSIADSIVNFILYISYPPRVKALKKIEQLGTVGKNNNKKRPYFYGYIGLAYLSMLIFLSDEALVVTAFPSGFDSSFYSTFRMQHHSLAPSLTNFF